MTDVEKIVETLRLGKRLLAEYGLDDWTFDLSNDKVTLGWCLREKKEIQYSVHYLHLDMSEIEETIRHEIAHALVGPKHGHDQVWKQMAIRVGARPKACAPPEIKSAAKPNFYIECSSCGQRWKRYRLKRKSYRGAVSSCCRAELKFYRVVKK